MRHFRFAGAPVLLVLLVLGGTLASQAGAQEMQYNQAELVRGLLPTVVNILAHAEVVADTSTMSAAADQPSQGVQVRTSAGSGFVVDPDGVIVTNWHVVDGAYEIYVTFSDGSRAKAEVLNAARIIDIALLKVSAGHPLTAIRWGDSSKVQIGDPVLAIGNPLGIGLSVTAGIVSALNRNIMDTPYDDFIQTDAPINHGNSGGPLFDLKGNMIGINTALISPTSASAGLGFAIPSNDAHLIVDRLTHFGWLRPGWLGVKIQQMTPEMALALGLPEPEGSIIAWLVPGGPAEHAGLRISDVILRFDGAAPSDDRALLRAIASSAPGRHVTLGVLRDGKEIQIPVTLSEWPKMQWEERDAPTKAAQPHWNIPADLGIKVTPLTDEMRAKSSYPSLPKEMEGVSVTAVARDADAARLGIAPGDVILEINGAAVGSADDLQRGIDRARGEGRTFALFLVLPKNPPAASQSAGPKWVALRIAAG